MSLYPLRLCQPPTQAAEQRLLNARLAYRTPNDRIEVAAWVRNFLDERYKVDVFDVSRDFNTILEVWGDPRTFGLTITLGF